MTINQSELPPLLRDFLVYHETIQGHSGKTVDEYCLDMRMYFRFLKIHQNIVPKDVPFDEIPIDDVTLSLVRQVSLTDIYAFMNYLSQARHLGPSARARKVATLRSFYRYLTSKAKLLTDNPIQDLDSPRLKKLLPKYLSLDESIQLLESIEEPNAQRDYCILLLFMSCGLRLSELVNLNLTDYRGEQLRVLGKGNKERMIFLSEACQEALEDWLSVRSSGAAIDDRALFLSRRHSRMTNSAIHYMVKQRLLKAGLDYTQYSSHKLRHTAATLMLQNGVDVRTLQEVLGHEHLNTTQIYTHVDNESLRIAAKACPLKKQN